MLRYGHHRLIQQIDAVAQNLVVVNAPVLVPILSRITFVSIAFLPLSFRQMLSNSVLMGPTITKRTTSHRPMLRLLSAEMMLIPQYRMMCYQRSYKLKYPTVDVFATSSSPALTSASLTDAASWHTFRLILDEMVVVFGRCSRYAI